MLIFGAARPFFVTTGAYLANLLQFHPVDLIGNGEWDYADKGGYHEFREHGGKMSINRAQPHDEILRKYNSDNLPWWQIPDDGYVYDHLAYHLREAGRFEELVRLLTTTPDWMNVRCRNAADCGPYLADLAVALEHITDPVDAEHLLSLVQLRAAWQVVHARQHIYEDMELKILVWLDRQEEALNYVRWRSNTEERCRGLLTIYRTLHAKGSTDDRLLDEVRDCSAAITDDIKKILILIETVKGYVQIGQYAKAETIARRFEESHNRVDALRILAAGLAKTGNVRASDIFAEALTEIRSNDDAWTRATYLQDIAFSMSRVENEQFAALRNQVRDIFLEAHRNILTFDLDYQSSSLCDLVYDLASGEYWVDAETISRSIQEELWRADALGELAEMIAESDPERAQLLFNEAEEVVRRIEDPVDFAVALRDLATNLARAHHDRAQTLFAEAREAIDKIRLGDSTLVTESEQEPLAAEGLLYGLVRGLAYAGMLGEVEKIAASAEDPWWGDMALATAVEISAEEERFDEAERVANTIQDDHWRAKALTSLADNLAPVDSKRAAIIFARTAKAVGIPTHNDRASTFENLAETLAKVGDSHALGVFAQARAMIQKIPKPEERARWMGLLVIRVVNSGPDQGACLALARELLAETQTLIKNIDDEWDRTSEPVHLAEHYAAAGLHVEASAMAQILEAYGEQAIALGYTAAALHKSQDKKQAREVFEEATTIARRIEENEARDAVLADLSEIMAWAGYYAEAEAMMRTITDSEDQACAFCELSEALTEAKQFGEARRIGQAIQDDYWRTWALGALASELALNKQFAEAEEVTQMMQADYWKPNALRKLTFSLAQAGQVTEAERIARMIQVDWHRATALGDLAAALMVSGDSHAPDLVAEALKIAADMSDPWDRAETLRDLAAILDEVDYKQIDSIFALAIAAAQEIDKADRRQSGLRDLVSTLAVSERYDDALAIAHMLEGRDSRLSALRDLASVLADNRCYAEALEVLGPLHFDEFIQFLACGAAYADSLEPTLVSTGLREALRIVGWVAPDYQTVYQELLSAGTAEQYKL